MGDKDFNGDIEEGFKYWWEDYDGDIEEERREIKKCVSKIEDPKKREARYEQLLNALEYDEYFMNNPHLKCESYLINLRLHFRGCEDENIDDFVDRILLYTEMERTPCPYKQNILIVNGNKKFTFLNTSKLNTGNKLDWEKILEKGKTKLRREYSYRGWKEGDDDNEKKFKVVCVRLRENWGDEYRDDDEDDEDNEEFTRMCVIGLKRKLGNEYRDDDEFIRVCDRIKAEYFNS